MKIKLPRKQIAVTKNTNDNDYIILIATQVGIYYNISKWQAKRASKKLELKNGEFLTIGNLGLRQQGYKLVIS